MLVSSPSGIQCSAEARVGNRCVADFPEGRSVNLVKVNMASGVVLRTWEGGCALPNMSICSVRMSGDQGVSARFGYRVETQTQTLPAGVGSGHDRPYMQPLSMAGQAELNDPVDLNNNDGGQIDWVGGSITPDSAVVPLGERVEFTLEPNAGFRVEEVTGCGGGTLSETPGTTTYTTGAIAGACTVWASFKQLSYTVTGEAGEGGSIDPTSQEVAHGETVNFEVTPNYGFRVTTRPLPGQPCQQRPFVWR